MKNRKFALTLNLEENQELMDEIDRLLRERVKYIIREEAEKMLGGTVQEEINRVVKERIANLKDFEWNTALQNAISNRLMCSSDVRTIIYDNCYRWISNHATIIENKVHDIISGRLKHCCDSEIIASIVNVFMGRK